LIAEKKNQRLLKKSASIANVESINPSKPNVSISDTLDEPLKIALSS
jgi:hypothetical protein